MGHGLLPNRHLASHLGLSQTEMLTKALEPALVSEDGRIALPGAKGLIGITRHEHGGLTQKKEYQIGRAHV